MGKIIWPTCLMALLLFCVSPVSGATNDVNIIWSTFQGNAAHNGYVPVSLDLNGFKHKWDKAFDSRLPLNPIVAADGRVFVTIDVLYNNVTALFVLDSENGSTLWSNDFGLVYTVNPPSYAAGKVFVQTVKEFDLGDWPSYLRAFDAADGTKVFENYFEAQWEGYFAPTVYADTVYFTGGAYGGLYASNASDGSGERFNDQLPQYDEWTPAADAQYVYAYVGGYLYALDPKDVGVIAFSIYDPGFVPDGSSMQLAPVIGNQKKVFVIQGGRLLSFDLEKGEIDQIGNANSYFTGQPSIANGMIYAIDNGNLSVWDESTGDFLWSLQGFAETLTGSMIVTDTHVFATTDMATYAIDLSSREAVFVHEAAGHIALGNDSLYIATKSGSLSAITLALVQDSAEPLSDNEPPVAVAGPDLIVRDEIRLDGSQSFDPDGAIISFEWEIRPRQNEETDLVLKTGAPVVEFLEGATPQAPELAPGFYDVTLTVTDEFGNTGKDTLLLAVAKKCELEPHSNAFLNVKRFRIKKFKRWNWTTASMLATIELPSGVENFDRQWIDSEIFIKLKFADRNDLVFSQKNKLKVKNHRRSLYIYK